MNLPGINVSNPDNPSSQHNLGAGLMYQVPSVAAWGLGRAVSPDMGEGAIALDSPMVKRLTELSGLDVGLLTPKTLPNLLGKPGPANAAYVAKPSPFQSAALGGFSPEELANWHRHGMIAPINMKEPAIAPEILSHELGHAMSHHGGPVASSIAKLRAPANMLGMLGGTVDTFRGVMGDKPQEERDRLLNNASTMFGAGSVPMLADEFNASRNAMRLLHRLPAGEGEAVLSRAARMLPRAWGGYGLAALGLTLGPQAAKWWYHTHPQ